jgi:hypothetical protein
MDIDPAQPGTGAPEGLAEEPEEVADEDEEGRPPDESTLMGFTGVQEQVEAEAARAEAELEGEAPPSGAEDAEV